MALEWKAWDHTLITILSKVVKDRKIWLEKEWEIGEKMTISVEFMDTIYRQI
jgi:hypothetical protein